MIEVAEAVRADVERASQAFRGWSEAEASRDRGAGKWTPKEVLGHLIDSAANNHQRFVRAQLAGAFAGPGYDQVAWVAVHRYRQRPWLELVDLWVALNRQVAASSRACRPRSAGRRAPSATARCARWSG